MGIYDQPANIDFILTKTGAKKIDAYIGHSMGTTQVFVGASLIPDYYKEKVNLFVALGPVAQVHNTNRSSAKFASQSHVTDTLVWLIKTFGYYCLKDYGDIGRNLQSSLCAWSERHCSPFDWDRTVDNMARFPDKKAHTPTGSSYRSELHFAQLIRNERFQRFDFGDAINMQKYGQFQPPAYNLSEISIPMAMLHGDIDPLSNPVDVKWLVNESGLN